MSRRRILLIVLDQMRADLIRGALAEHVRLPAIAAFRREAVTFLNHFTVVNPCGPSRASLLTGQYAMNHRSVRNGTPLAREKPNLAMEMRKSGYEPLLFGYTDTTQDPRGLHPADPRLTSYEMPMEGFNEVLEMRLESGALPWRAHLASKGYELPKEAWRIYGAVSPDPSRPPRVGDPPLYDAGDSDTAFLTTRFLQEMGVRRGTGWFAMLNYLRPHPPFVAPEPYNRMYDPAALPPPVHLADAAAEEAVHPYMAAQRAYRLSGTYVPGGPELDDASDADTQRLRAVYLGLASEVDAHLGRVFAHLKETGEYDDTLIILTADHAEMLGDHFTWGKFHFYEPAWRIPLMIRDPERPGSFGTEVEAFTESIDIAPTILDYAGRAAPAGMDGRSLRGFLEGAPPADWRDCVHMELDFGEPDTPTKAQRALGIPLKRANLAILREARWKLVHFSAALPPLLFDMENDPGELRNLAGDPAHAGTLLRMTQKLLSHRMAHMDGTLSGMRATAGGMFGYDPLA